MAQSTTSSETLSNESLTTPTQIDGDRPRHGRSDSGVSSDATSPPTSTGTLSLNGLATRLAARGSFHAPQSTAQPRHSPRQSAHAIGEEVELQYLRHPERETRPDGEVRSASDRRSSNSSTTTRTTDTWLTFVTGSLSETFRYPQNNWALFVLALHYAIFLCYSVVQLVVNVLNFQASASPNPVEQTIARMQKLFGELAHGDAMQAHKDTERLLDALSSKASADARWEIMLDKFIEIVDACVGYANQTLAGTRCAEAWKAANLNASQYSTPAVAPSDALQKRKLQKIREVFDDHDLKIRSSSSLSSPIQNPLLSWIAITCVVSVVVTVLLFTCCRSRFGKSFTLSVRTFRNNWLPDIKEDSGKDHEKAGIDTVSSGVSSSLGSRDLSTLARRTGIPDARHLPNNVWEVAARGLLEELKALQRQQQHFEINQVHPRYGTMLSAAARSGNATLVSYILDLGADLGLEGGHYHNALQSGAYSGNVKVVQKLLDAGARDTSVGGYFGTALNAAAEKGSSEMVAKLLRRTANSSSWLNVPGGLHGRAIIAAASRGQTQMVLDLLSHDADLNGTNEAGETALHAAAAGNYSMIVQELLQRHSNIDALSMTYGTALHVACRGKFPNVAILLIERGASVNITDYNLRTVLHEASKGGLTAVVSAILSKDDSMVSAQDADGNTALHHAAIGGHAEVASLLIKHNINVSVGDKFKAQALFRAAGCKHPDVVRILLDEGKADPNAVDYFNQTALHGPAETDDVRVQHLLINAGCNVNARGAFNRTALHEACNMARYKNVELLLSQPDIDVNVVDDNQTTPLCRSLCSTDGRYLDQCIDARIPMMLLNYKELECEHINGSIRADARKDIDVNLCNGLALQEAARRNLIEVLRRMVTEHDANIHIAGGKYGGVLQAAAIGGDGEVVELLLKYKANPNLQGGEFGTPLAAAAAHGNAAVVRLLLENGADATMTGIGKYGSAFGSVCKALKVEETGRAKIDYLKGQIETILKGWGGELMAHMPHVDDRWQLMPSGWGFNFAGEL